MFRDRFYHAVVATALSVAAGTLPLLAQETPPQPAPSAEELANRKKIEELERKLAVLAEELQGAEVLILVDATMEPLERGLRWSRVQPEGQLSPCGMHHLKPSMLAGLLESLYQRSPTMWLVSVQGDDFGFGEGLSLEAQEKAERASSEIVQFCWSECIDKRQGSINDGADGST